MSLPDYIAKDPTVQIAFILGVVAILFMNFFFLNLRKKERLEDELRVISKSRDVSPR